MLRRLSCLVHGGHDWRTITDTAGSVTSCGRCNVVRHYGTITGDSVFRSHTNLGYEVDSRESRGGNTHGDERPMSK